MIIKRNIYLDKLISYKNNGKLKLITGARRSGKSYLLRQLFKKHLLDTGADPLQIIDISFADSTKPKYRDAKYCINYMLTIIKDRRQKNYYIIFDDAYLMPNINLLLERLREFDNLDIYLISSKSSFLRDTIMSKFFFETDEITVYPLSFKEFYDASSLSFDDALTDYCLYGGFPAVWQLESDAEKRKYLHNLFQQIYLPSIIENHQLQQPNQLVQIIDLLAHSLGTYINTQRIINHFDKNGGLNLSAPTIKTYLGHLESDFLVHFLIRYQVNRQKFIRTPHKIYFIDFGIRNVFLDFKSTVTDELIENIIYKNLLNKTDNIDLGVVVTRERDENKKYHQIRLSISFTASINYKIYAMQVVHKNSTQKQIQKLEDDLLQVNLRFKKIMIFVNGHELIEEKNKVLKISLQDFLFHSEYWL